MENAVDALYMGFAILAFVVALSLSIFSFSEVTSASQRIIDARDKTTQYTYYKPQGTSRTVTREDIIPTLYRAYYENYAVRFENLNLYQGGLYKARTETVDVLGNKTITYEPTYTIDLEEQKIGNHDDADKLIKALLKGNGEFESLITDTTRFSHFQGLQIGSFYDILGGKTFKEDIGLYYMEDKGDTLKEGVDDVNKTRKRVITYTVNTVINQNDGG